jgi:hypothetical protein
VVGFGGDFSRDLGEERDFSGFMGGEVSEKEGGGLCWAIEVARLFTWV